jgi:hypothetical protein
MDMVEIGDNTLNLLEFARFCSVWLAKVTSLLHSTG